jgi:hypothetical protein
MKDDEEFELLWEGRGDTLHDALEDAWSRAKEDQAEPGTYVVQGIAVETENPIRTYIVIIGPGE